MPLPLPLPLTTAPPAVPPDIVVPPQSQEVLLNSLLNLTCEASGRPPPSILWLLNNTVVSWSPVTALGGRGCGCGHADHAR